MKMLRILMLSLVLLLITLSAAYLGQDEERAQVLRLTKLPGESQEMIFGPKQAPPSSSAPSASAPGESGEPQDSESEAPQIEIPESSSGTARYFVPDSSLEAASGDERAQASGDPEQESSQDAEDEDGEDSEDSVSYVLDGDDVQAAAQPYINELDALTQSSAKALEEIGRQAIMEYFGMSSQERKDGMAKLAEQYMPSIQALEKDTDDRAEDIIGRLEQKLSDMGADTAMADDLRESYAESKKENVDYYSGIIQQLAG